MVIAGNVVGTSGADAHPQRGLDHGIDDSGIASHPEIVVPAPYNDVTGGTAAAPDGMGWALGVPLEIGEHPVTVPATDFVEE
jgi:hypothetical protein